MVLLSWDFYQKFGNAYLFVILFILHQFILRIQLSHSWVFLLGFVGFELTYVYSKVIFNLICVTIVTIEINILTKL
jgi:hypothetical protein